MSEVAVELPHIHYAFILTQGWPQQLRFEEDLHHRNECIRTAKGHETVCSRSLHYGQAPVSPIYSVHMHDLALIRAYPTPDMTG